MQYEPVAHLRIVSVLRQFRPIVGGEELLAERLALQLQDSGHTTRIVTARIEPTSPRRERLGGLLDVVRLPAPRIRAIGSLTFVVALLVYLTRHRREYDVIEAHATDYAAFAAALAGRWLSKPVVCKVCGGRGYGLRKARLRHVPVEPLLRHGLHLVDRMISVSQVTDGELQTIGYPGDRIVRIPNGVDVQAFQPLPASRFDGEPDRSRCPRVVYVGRLSPEKGPDVLIEAFRLLAARGETSFQLCIVGDGRLRPSLERTVRSCGLSDQVEFVGNASDVRPYLHAADLFVLPSRVDALPIALLEAMACGLPVVATRSGGPAEVIQHGRSGLLVEPGDADALARAMRQVLTHPELAGPLAQEGRRVVEEEYSIESVAERHVEVYRELLTRRGSTTEKSGSPR